MITLILIAAIALTIITTYVAGRYRAKFEVILIFDSLKFWKGAKFSRDAFFNQSKDRNKDGKISYWEITFPNDGGHRTKLWEVILISESVCLSGISLVKSAYWISEKHFGWQGFLIWSYSPILLIPIFFLTYSLGFRHALNKYRQTPPISKFHPDYSLMDIL